MTTFNDRPTFTWEAAERIFPDALSSFPGGDLGGYTVTWSFPTVRSTDIDGICVIPADPGATGYLYHKDRWRKL